ncbi:MarR family winged helix-turn-helix transcriptional regulator [Labrys monachus]|uniref:DNA-binding MarR family transcriptional regulator n=1 Tax=Labrys monachus TaxID=217067 RepID=A0ABU0FFC8_9HYPH|nr:MarR family winged helix-turn-helix transcriptional regulator [Labrys monachus]MDQ0393312.1 DNA-binding MarR family transcriptional regulator [Labrys monachus]
METPCNCLALRQAARRVTQLYDLALAPLDLRATQYSLLSRTEALGPIALNRLAEVLVMDRATLGHNVRPLEARGLVRLDVGEDRRSRELSLTEAGRSLLAEARSPWRKAQQAFEDEIGAQTASALRAQLHRVAATEFALPGRESSEPAL